MLEAQSTVHYYVQVLFQSSYKIKLTPKLLLANPENSIVTLHSLRISIFLCCLLLLLGVNNIVP